MSVLNHPKEKLILYLTCVFWVISKLISYKLWLSNRVFPLIPAFEFLNNIPNYVHLFLLIFSILGIILIIFYPKNNYFFILLILIQFFSYLLDQNRWQPYEYQYFLTIVLFFVYKNDYKKFINYFSFLLIVIYFQSGLHKFSGSFLYSIWEKVILVDFFQLSYNQINKPWIHYSGLILAFIETIFPLFIFFTNYKKQAAIGLIAMHLFIILMLSPLGLNMNSVVWPWNTAMILFLYVLFIYKNEKIVIKDLIIGRGIVFFIIIGILPFLNFFGKFDNFLSFNLYSGSPPVLEICLNEDDSKIYKPFLYTGKTNCNCENFINIKDWSIKEMNIIAIPEERFYNKIIQHWKKNNPKSKATFIIYKYPYNNQNIKIIH